MGPPIGGGCGPQLCKNRLRRKNFTRACARDFFPVGRSSVGRSVGPRSVLAIKLYFQLYTFILQLYFSIFQLYTFTLNYILSFLAEHVIPREKIFAALPPIFFSASRSNSGNKAPGSQGPLLYPAGDPGPPTLPRRGPWGPQHFFTIFSTKKYNFIKQYKSISFKLRLYVNM